MACNCKRKVELEEKYGEPIVGTWFDKIHMFALKMLGFIVVISIMVVFVPILIVVSVFKMFFSKNKSIVLPNFLGKYLKQ